MKPPDDRRRAVIEGAESVPAPPALATGWSELLGDAEKAILEPALMDWLPRQRWFGAKTRTIESVRVRNWAELEPGGAIDPAGVVAASASSANAIPQALFFVDVTYLSGTPDTYQIPLAISTGAEMDSIAMNRPQSIIAPLTSGTGPAILHDASAREDFQHELMQLIARNGTLAMASGEASSVDDQFPKADRLDARAATGFPADLAVERLPSRVASAEQSNTSILYGDRFILKLYRRLQAGENPDVEMGRFLSDVAHFQKIPPFYGEISIGSATSDKTTVAMLQGLVANQGDGWQWFLNQLSEWFESIAGRHAPQDSLTPSLSSERKPIPEALFAARESLEAAALLGERTAEMHLALSRNPILPAFAPEPMTREDLAGEAERIEAQIESALDALKQKVPTLDDPTAGIAGLLLSRRPDLIAKARSLKALEAGGQRIRIHGDYHLGQTLRTGSAGGDEEAVSASSAGDFVILDFEGEPARSIEERRRKQSPLKDAAGMMRSFSYVSFAALDHLFAAKDRDKTVDVNDAAGWARLWQNSASAMFLWAYTDTIGAAPALFATPKETQDLLNAYVLEKALYELLYELNNRPAWLSIPINGILAL